MHIKDVILPMYIRHRVESLIQKFGPRAVKEIDQIQKDLEEKHDLLSKKREYYHDRFSDEIDSDGKQAFDLRSDLELIKLQIYDVDTTLEDIIYIQKWILDTKERLALQKGL